MERIREARSLDLTGRPAEGPSEAMVLDNFKKLAACHQPEGSPCKLFIIMGDDVRCKMSRRMQVSCPYLGKVEPLKTQLEDEKEERHKDEQIHEAPPEIEL